MILSYFVGDFYCYFTIGILVSFGFSLIYLPTIVIMAEYFENKLYFAIRLALCGAAFNLFTFEPLNDKLIQLFGLKAAFLIKSFNVPAAIGCLCGMLMRPGPNQHSDLSIKSPSFLRKANELSLFSDWIFLIFAVSIFLVTHFFAIFDAQIDFFDFQTSDKGWGSTLKLTMGISNIFGFGLSLIAYLKEIKRIYLYASILAICGFSTLIEPYFVHDYKYLFIYSIIIGFSKGNIIIFKGGN